jgi:hypothetical protein
VEAQAEWGAWWVLRVGSKHCSGAAGDGQGMAVEAGEKCWRRHGLAPAVGLPGEGPCA